MNTGRGGGEGGGGGRGGSCGGTCPGGCSRPSPGTCAPACEGGTRRMAVIMNVHFSDPTYEHYFYLGLKCVLLWGNGTRVGIRGEIPLGAELEDRRRTTAHPLLATRLFLWGLGSVRHHGTSPLSSSNPSPWRHKHAPAPRGWGRTGAGDGHRCTRKTMRCKNHGSKKEAGQGGGGI